MNVLTITFIVVAIAFIIWLITSIFEFKKMEDDPEDYRERRTFKSMSDGSEEL